MSEHPDWQWATHLPLGSKLVMLCLVGSHAYGMQHEGSDKDYLGVYQVPTRDVLGLTGYKETVTHSGPEFENDVTYHELQKFMKLAIKANPTVLELLYLPEENYVALSEEAEALIKYRHLFLSERTVRDSFGGYAIAQARRLERRGDSFSSETKNRTAKHARHCFRLLRQGEQLLVTGSMTVKVDNRDELFELGRLPVPEIVAKFEDEFERFKAVESDLPEKPDIEALSYLLASMRLRPLELDVAHLQEQVDNSKALVKELYRLTGGSYYGVGADTIGKLAQTGESHEQEGT